MTSASLIFSSQKHERIQPLSVMVKAMRSRTKSWARFTPLLRGIIFGLHLANVPISQIQLHSRVVKTDGSRPSRQSITDAIRLVKKNGPKWDGVSTRKGKKFKALRTGGGVLRKRIMQCVFRNRGRAVVTADYIRKRVKGARNLSKRTIQRRLSEAGLAWLRRRRKNIIIKEHRLARVSFSKWVLERTVTTLHRWAYSDGTTFYLARSQVQLADKVRAALGPMVWRRADGSDGLYEECIGPSQYWKAQGTAVRVWGLLVNGILFITVLVAGETMNRHRYAWVVAQKFPMWIAEALGRKAHAFLVQDHERCLWTEEPRRAMKENNITLLENYPKCSQDLNAIETAWREVRNRLYTTQPKKFEDRPVFIRRLRRAVEWVNEHRSSYLLHICQEQKRRASEVIELKGGRTKN